MKYFPILLGTCIIFFSCSPKLAYIDHFEFETAKDTILQTFIGNAIFQKGQKNKVFKLVKNTNFPTPYNTSYGPKFNFDHLFTITNEDELIYYAYEIESNIKVLKYNGFSFFDVSFDLINNELTQIYIFRGGPTRYHGEELLPRGIMVKETASKKFKTINYELLYQGIHNNSIVLKYKEYKENLPIESLFQTLYYDLNEIKKQSNIIIYKEIKIQLFDISNNSLQYKILN